MMGINLLLSRCPARCASLFFLLCERLDVHPGAPGTPTHLNNLSFNTTHPLCAGDKTHKSLKTKERKKNVPELSPGSREREREHLTPCLLFNPFLAAGTLQFQVLSHYRVHSCCSLYRRALSLIINPVLLCVSHCGLGPLIRC